MRPVLALALALAAVNAAAACPAPPQAVIDIDANSYYTDKHHSVIDPVLRARNIANTKPIEDYLSAVSKNAGSTRADDRRCALDWMAAWAGRRAMLGKMSTEQSWYQRKWTLAGLALSYARVKSEASPEQKQVIEAWFKSLADETMAHSDARKGVRNNHYYWEGLAVAAAGAVVGDERQLAWGRKVFDHAMSQVAGDGSLPLEMARASKALHYHVFSVQPLVLLASILDVQSPKLDQLVRFTVNGARDSSGIAKTTGFEQEAVKPGNMSWLMIYTRHGGKAEFPITSPGVQTRMGGDLAVANPLEHLH
ncbi:alginate lyase family protein [Massilia endophytica]|uniref:alginate lyase family protein n=1 Tax=Massilia endophytica TaxID=2899220 RepID=UPI001E46B988|nr:alginate lyase family protein [Massilia endophytica]UGQ45507.1 alginate lyase family protein [Massilia endophytica]